MRAPALAVVVANAVVVLAHGVAHRNLGVLLDPWQQVFVYTVIVPGPLVGLALLRRRPRAGHAVLFATMLGSLLFGVYHHFVAVSPDHVAHLPSGDAQGLFRVTAVLMALLQAGGAAVGALGLGWIGAQQPTPRG